MYRKNKVPATSISINTSYIGETIEQKIQRIVNNKEPITDGAPLIFTERRDGVMPEYDPRTDRFDVAIEAMDKVSKSHKAKREERLRPIEGGKKDDNANPAEPGQTNEGGA